MLVQWGYWQLQTQQLRQSPVFQAVALTAMIHDYALSLVVYPCWQVQG